MHYLQLSVLFVLAAAPLVDPTMSHASLWDDMRVKHMWNAVPTNWESLGHPPADTTTDLHIALEPHHKNALIDALHEVSDPRHPKHVLLPLFCSCLYSRVPCSVSDMVNTCQRSRSLN